MTQYYKRESKNVRTRRRIGVNTKKREGRKTKNMSKVKWKEKRREKVGKMRSTNAHAYM